MSRSLLLIGDESEASATLHEALAFIDAFEIVSSTSDVDHSSGESTKYSQARPPIEKKRSHTERVKAELERLRADAEALEATLKRLKQNSSKVKQMAGTSTRQIDSHSSSSWVTGRRDPRMAEWMEIVAEQCHRRRESEALNRRLRGILAKQINMLQASQSALSSKFTPADLNTLYGSRLDTDVARSLSSRVQALQLDVGNILKRTGLIHVDSLLSWSQRKHDERLGVFFEVTSCLPVRYSLEQIREAFARQSPCTDGQIVDVQLDRTDVYKHTSETVEYHEQLYNIAKNGALRVLVEDDRIVYVWTAQASLPSKQWTFFEDSILIVRRSSANAPTSLLQKWHRVWMSQPGTPSVSDLLPESILSTLSRRGSDYVRVFRSSLESTMDAKG